MISEKELKPWGGGKGEGEKEGSRGEDEGVDKVREGCRHLHVKYTCI